MVAYWQPFKRHRPAPIGRSATVLLLQFPVQRNVLGTVGIRQITSLILEVTITPDTPNSNIHRTYAGRMFGFSRKKLCGSYCFLICASFGRLKPKLSFIAF